MYLHSKTQFRVAYINSEIVKHSFRKILHKAIPIQNDTKRAALQKSHPFQIPSDFNDIFCEFRNQKFSSGNFNASISGCNDNFFTTVSYNPAMIGNAERTVPFH